MLLKTLLTITYGITDAWALALLRHIRLPNTDVSSAGMLAGRVASMQDHHIAACTLPGNLSFSHARLAGRSPS